MFKIVKNKINLTNYAGKPTSWKGKLNTL